MTDVSKVLREARRLIAEVGFTTKAYARDAAGRMVAPTNNAACCFCSLGAINRAGSGSTLGFRNAVASVLQRAIAEIDPTSTGCWVDDWSDAQTSAEPVLAAFDKAIEIEESR